MFCPLRLLFFIRWKVWGEEAVARAAKRDEADWRVFDAANDILDLRLWTVRTNDRRLTTNGVITNDYHVTTDGCL